jgi:hypothetical protein
MKQTKNKALNAERSYSAWPLCFNNTYDKHGGLNHTQLAKTSQLQAIPDGENLGLRSLMRLPKMPRAA